MTPEIAWRQKYEDEFHRNAALLLTEQRLRQELAKSNAIIKRFTKGAVVTATDYDTFANGTSYIKGTVVIRRGPQIVCRVDEWPELAEWLERQSEEQ